jgi:hypothetical protein
MLIVVSRTSAHGNSMLIVVSHTSAHGNSVLIVVNYACELALTPDRGVLYSYATYRKQTIKKRHKIFADS